MNSTFRLFSCGTSKEGESYLVEWNESEGAVKRTYQGFHKRSLGVVQFDTIKNRFLAACDEFVIKFWDMDNVNLLLTIDAEGGLPVRHIMESLIHIVKMPPRARTHTKSNNISRTYLWNRSISDIVIFDTFNS